MYVIITLGNAMILIDVQNQKYLVEILFCDTNSNYV